MEIPFHCNAKTYEENRPNRLEPIETQNQGSMLIIHTELWFVFWIFMVYQMENISARTLL